jgi:hypothetical protein
VEISVLSLAQRKKIEHKCTNHQCTNYKRCPTQWLAVCSSSFFEMIFFQKHPKAKELLKSDDSSKSEDSKKKKVMDI